MTIHLHSPYSRRITCHQGCARGTVEESMAAWRWYQVPGDQRPHQEQIHPFGEKRVGVCKRRRCEIYTGLCWSILRKNLKKLRRRDGNETCPFQTNCWVSCYLFIGGNVIQTLHLWIQIGVLVHIHYMYVLCLKICWFVTTEFYLLYTFRLPISCTTIGRFIWKFLVLIINIQKNILYDLENEKILYM